MPFHTPPSAEVAGYAGFALFEALSDLLIIKDVLTRNEVDELLARTASRSGVNSQSPRIAGPEQRARALTSERIMP